MTKRKRGWIIAMDGPAGVGKSTVAQLTAKQLGYCFINTGEMYRALTWEVLERNINVEDAAVVVQLAKSLNWDFKTDDEGVVLRTYVNGIAMAGKLHLDKVSANVSAVAGIPEVRSFFVALQQKLGKNGGIVMEGRDIMTNVFPDAEVKIYLDASAEERALRRYNQLKSAGVQADLKKIQADIVSRDRRDSENLRQYKKLKVAEKQHKTNDSRISEDAIVVDSTHLKLNEVADEVLKHIRSKRNGHS